MESEEEGGKPANPLDLKHFTESKELEVDSGDLADINSPVQSSEVGEVKVKEIKDKINQGQFYDLITGEEVSWQALIYDLVKTEQLDPWDIDLGVLANKYVGVIEGMEEGNFFVSSKVLLACALLLRLKSEILSNRYIAELDEALYGKKEEKKYELERIEIDEDEIPLLIPRTPIPRHKKVTLDELMGALNQAIDTENRRIKKEINVKQAERSALVVLPKGDKIPLKVRIAQLYNSIKEHVRKPKTVHMTFSELAPSRAEKLAAFVPILHLANHGKIHLRQDAHFEEVYMALRKMQQEIGELREDVAQLFEKVKK